MLSNNRPNADWRHLCIDMQRMFAEDTPWHVDWMKRITDNIECLVDMWPHKTIFTRFVPPQNPRLAVGQWKQYYEKWWMMTGEHLPGDLTEVIPRLAAYIPPAADFPKATYSPWTDGRLHQTLSDQGVRSLVVSGGETDVCVLAGILGAIDLGYRVFVVQDAVCSTDDATHDASLVLLGGRFASQVTLITTSEWLKTSKEILRHSP